MRSLIYAVLLALLVVLLTACNIFSALGDRIDGEREHLVRSIVQGVTTHHIDDDMERAESIREIAQEVRDFVKGNPDVTLDRVDARVRSLIEERRGEVDNDAEAILAGVRGRLDERIRAGALDPTDRVLVLQVLDWVEAATYAAVPPADDS